MSYVALLVLGYIALSRIQRVVWALRRLVLGAIAAGLAWALSRGWSP